MKFLAAVILFQS